MAVGLEYLRWSCFEGGYEWQDAGSIWQQQNMAEPKHRDTRFLVPCSVEERTRLYHPMVNHPTLFKEFAAIPEAAEAAFAAFAKKYGMLTSGQILDRSGPFQLGEPESTWWTEWARMRAVVHVLDLIQAHSLERLREIIKVGASSARFDLNLACYRGSAHLACNDPAMQLRPWLWEYAMAATTEVERLARFASGWTQDEINTSLTSDERPATVNTSVLFNHERQSYSLHMVPTSLIGAMWLQCARVLTENPQFKACENCGKWFELSPDARRKQSKYCSDRCKVAAYRGRRVMGTDKIYAWMNPYYASVRSRSEWTALSFEERVAALKNEINIETDGRHANTLDSTDRAGRWPRALSELEDSWKVSHSEES